MRILLLDNHDSFTYNLAALLGNNGKVTFNIETPEQLVIAHVSRYDGILFSPGPGHPDEHPVMTRLLARYGSSTPFLGICLGMQAMARYFGAGLVNLPEVVHGQPRKIRVVKPDHYLFRDVPQGSFVGLYHSWAVNPEGLPPCLEPLAFSSDGIIMALAHRELELCGVQFHPESIMTPQGQKIIDNWIEAIG